MIARLLCRLRGHRFAIETERWAGAVVTVRRCPRCGRWECTIATRRAARRFGPKGKRS